MIELIPPAFNYVTSDTFFWASMAFTTMVGIFIGAVVHNGDLEYIKKTLVSLFCYSLLIISVNLSRVIPKLETGEITAITNRPLAPTVTVFLVTLFYLIGMFIGVLTVRKAHPKKLAK